MTKLNVKKNVVISAKAFLPKLVTNHNAPVKTVKKLTKLKTRLVAGADPLPKMATNHNSRIL